MPVPRSIEASAEVALTWKVDAGSGGRFVPSFTLGSHPGVVLRLEGADYTWRVYLGEDDHVGTTVSGGFTDPSDAVFWPKMRRVLAQATSVVISEALADYKF